MTIEEMKNRKIELGYSNEKLAEVSGVPLGTIIKIFSGSTKSPRRKTIQALEAVLGISTASSTSAASYGIFSAGQKHRYTIEDYRALPEDRRVELIDGVFYDMAAPTYNHQFVLGEIAHQFYTCIKEHQSPCRLLFAPCEVQLDKDDFTMLQPDILIVCDVQNQLQNGICYGAPDMTIEILSPASRSHDMIRKLNKYRNAGVREYWIVDPEEKQVYVYQFEEKNTFLVYSFNDEVPVGISDDICRIDFKSVDQAMI